MSRVPTFQPVVNGVVHLGWPPGRLSANGFECGSSDMHRFRVVDEPFVCIANDQFRRVVSRDKSSA